MPRSSPAGGLSRRDLLKGVAATGIGALTGTLAHGYLYDRHHVELTRDTVHVSGLPAALAGLRVGLLTDLHRSQTVAHETITRAVDLVMAHRSTIIFVNARRLAERLATRLNELAAERAGLALDDGSAAPEVVKARVTA